MHSKYKVTSREERKKKTKHKKKVKKISKFHLEMLFFRYLRNII